MGEDLSQKQKVVIDSLYSHMKTLAETHIAGKKSEMESAAAKRNKRQSKYMGRCI